MTSDNLKQAWQAQTERPRLTIETDLLLKEVQRNQQYFAATMFWRDVREAGVAILLVPVWLYMGVSLALPWTWYLTIPALAWIALCMLRDLMRHKSTAADPAEPLRRRLENSLAEVDHQIRLIRNIFWWYLLPLALPVMAFIIHLTWLTWYGNWFVVVVYAALALLATVAFWCGYLVNQTAVNTSLIPRRQELEALLASLDEEPQ